MNLVVAPPSSAAVSRRIRVMLVDDAVVVRGLFARWVESEPDLDVVATLRTGREAVDQLERVDPDVVVLDVDMPELDGIAALPLLLEKKRDLVVIMASTLTRRNAEISLRALVAWCGRLHSKTGQQPRSQRFYGVSPRPYRKNSPSRSACKEVACGCLARPRAAGNKGGTVDRAAAGRGRRCATTDNATGHAHHASARLVDRVFHRGPASAQRFDGGDRERVEARARS